jgi:hypothetical protein
MLIWRNKFIESRKNALIQLYPAKQHECKMDILDLCVADTFFKVC